MTAGTPRVRMFAGPNGSGKSTLKGVIGPELYGVYINADEIAQGLQQTGKFDLSAFGLKGLGVQLNQFLEISDRLADLKSIGLLIGENSLSLPRESTSPYLAAVLAEFVRHELLKARRSFTFETVMSHPSKVELLREAQSAGYRTYLYFVATEDPDINCSRVENRVRKGGHSVPPDKTVSRYYRSLDLLWDAIQVSNRAFVFDNSSDNVEKSWLAEITDGETLEYKSDTIPQWFKRYVLDKATDS
ncbi:zeta toxin family protein [Pelagicoccus sp. SDUM812003]|uniref:zeta toxin family protein n=1 Tax=Pelagicoccus sp. SDUM812003 TaxID=3041267 RepID=UPI00280E266A|nr:zeta toxin family protein [Pelagicoccus sp. SDUM812003]MDQ8201486.1 zeta toxin family protein [Pelagicoccus sp. SDUM812003]